MLGRRLSMGALQLSSRHIPNRYPLELVTYQEQLQLLPGQLLSSYLVAGSSISLASSRDLT